MESSPSSLILGGTAVSRLDLKVLNISEPRIASPKVAPNWRKKFTEAVPVPRSRCGRAFCTASWKVGIQKPIPRPSSTM